ncbi:hypothetical protein Avbf_09691 [Armadillidium vulgare]|nr:hypothetical protein Avbf_09691 [Armadillidium vulgare]
MVNMNEDGGLVCIKDKNKDKNKDTDTNKEKHGDMYKNEDADIEYLAKGKEIKYRNFVKEIAICIALPYIIELPDGRLTVLGAGLDYSDEEDDEEGEEDDEGYENSYNRYNHFSFGLPGRSCLLKAICETAEEPIESLGLLGEMLTMLLSPGFGGEMEEMREFVDAEITGRLNSTCFDSFKDCPIHLVDFLHSGVSMLHSGLISAN